MNISKAIDIKKKYQYVLPKESYPELIEADNLSIEALEHMESERTIYGYKRHNALPGETEE